MLFDFAMRGAKLLLLLAVMTLAGCGQGGGRGIADGSPSDGSGDVFSLPAPWELRQLSADAGTSPFCYASGYDMDLPYSRVSPAANSLGFYPEKDFDTGQVSPAYAMYRLGVPEYQHEPVLRTESSDNLSNVWIGFANFQRNRWDWQSFSQLLPSNYQNSFNPELHVQDNRIMIAVVATGIASVEWLVAGDTTQPYITDVQPKLMMTGNQLQFRAKFQYSPAETYQWDLGEGLAPRYSAAATPVATALLPGTYTGSLSVINALGTDSFDFSYEIAPNSEIPPLHLQAIPAQTEVSVDEPVLVTIRCGNFPQQEQMGNCRINLLVSEHASYVPNSFNVGSPGGDKYAIDGIWALAPDPPSDWLAYPDEWYRMLSTDIEGIVRLEISASPIDGGDTSVGGDIFNIQLAFSQPGVYELGFMPDDSTTRTVYRNASNDLFSWYDISNDAAPAITVTQ